MSLEKIPAILLVGLGIHVSLTAPTLPTPKNERRIGDGPVEVNWLLRVVKAGYWICAIVELCIVLTGTTKSGSTWSKQVMALLLPNGKPPECIRLTPITTLATILVVSGAAIRYWCFREMGRNFTFHVTLLKNHKLVTTGPYSTVRHPAYTGGIFMAIGKVIWYTARGSWLRESVVYQTKLSWLLIAPVMLSIFLTVANIPRRMRVEDEILKREFGREWDEWANAVPYRLFPGVH